MSKKGTIGKIILASTLVLAGGVTSFSPNMSIVQAGEILTEANYKESAQSFINAALKGDWELAHSYLSENLQSVVTKESLATYWSGFTAPYGEIQNSSIKDIHQNAVHTRVTFLMTSKAGEYEFILNLDTEGKVDDFSSTTHYPSDYFPNPEYDHPDKYIEKQVSIGEGTFSLPGILTIPKGDGPFPVVVLVHGSGPNDMDETSSVSKSFRDIAKGLANEGLAVLRYDKRTYTHPIKSSLEPVFTIQKETVLDANLAVKTLRAIPEIDTDNIFVLGHSQGAFALPLILEDDKNGYIKGAIGVAGPAGKFQDLLLWQIEQQVERAEKMNAPKEQIQALKQNLAFFQEQIGIINNPDITIENLPENYQFGTPHWWFDIRDYIPANLAIKQKTPLLILHGAKDLQVPASHFEEWMSTLKDRSNVDYKLYPDMIHMLVNYAGEPNMMTEYTIPGNVPQEFLSDISQWVKTGEIETSPKIDLEEYKDYKKDQYWSDAVAWAIHAGVLKGFQDEKLIKPYEPMNESQYLNVYFRYKLGEELKDESLASIYKLAKEVGFPVKEKPYTPISRGEAAVLLAKSFTNMDLSEEEAVQWLYEQKIVNGFQDEKGGYPKSYQSFQPNKTMSRAHLVTMLHRLNNIKAEL